MKISKPISGLLLVIGLGTVTVAVYGLPLFISVNASFERSLRICSVLFLFGAWAGIVSLTERRPWRHWTNATLFTLLGFYTAETLNNPSTTTLQFILFVCFAVGYFGDKWIQGL